MKTKYLAILTILLIILFPKVNLNELHQGKLYIII
jgi:hypothetical protein